MTIRAQIDRVIDWYEKHSFVVGRVIPVLAAPSTLRKFARKQRGGPFIYRDCELVPIGKARDKRRRDANKQTELTYESGDIADDHAR